MKLTKLVLGLSLGLMASGVAQAKQATIKTFSNGCTRTCSCASGSSYQNCDWVSNGSSFSCQGGTPGNIVVGVVGSLDCSNCKLSVKPVGQNVSCSKGSVAAYDSSGVSATCSTSMPK